MNNILKFPKQETISENDKLFLEIENQAQIIKNKRKTYKRCYNLKRGLKNVRI